VLGAFAVALAAGGGVVALVSLVLSGSTEPRDQPSAVLPGPVTPALAIPRPRLLSISGGGSHWSIVLHRAGARSAPERDAPLIAMLPTRTPEGTTNLVTVLTTESSADGRIWSRVRLPVLPNNTTGWVPRSALGPTNVVDTRLVVDRAALRITLYRGGRAIFTAPVGVGTMRWPTPAGEFYIRDRLAGFVAPFYGPVAFGTSARSAVLTDWPAGGFVGIHGTDEPWLLPGRVSHGCIRMRNRDILALAKLLPIGTPLTIR
jgi:lipoprotein-anchoring transpeptidase ErfK/SrfK